MQTYLHSLLHWCSSRLVIIHLMGNLSAYYSVFWFILIALSDPQTCSYASLDGNHSFDFPHDLNTWVHASRGSSVANTEVRIWNTSDLEAAFSVLNLSQMQSFFEHLEAGKSVTVLAIGDSIVKDFGGCFHRNR